MAKSLRKRSRKNLRKNRKTRTSRYNGGMGGFPSKFENTEGKKIIVEEVEKIIKFTMVTLMKNYIKR